MDVAPLVAAAGFYDDVDVLISFHAASDNTSEFGSMHGSRRIQIQGYTRPCGGGSEKGASALDAVELMNVAVNFLRNT